MYFRYKNFFVFKLFVYKEYIKEGIEVEFLGLLYSIDITNQINKIKWL